MKNGFHRGLKEVKEDEAVDANGVEKKPVFIEDQTYYVENGGNARKDDTDPSCPGFELNKSNH